MNTWILYNLLPLFIFKYYIEWAGGISSFFTKKRGIL